MRMRGQLGTSKACRASCFLLKGQPGAPEIELELWNVHGWLVAGKLLGQDGRSITAPLLERLGKGGVPPGMQLRHRMGAHRGLEEVWRHIPSRSS
jgi:hypothetical protein